MNRTAKVMRKAVIGRALLSLSKDAWGESARLYARSIISNPDGTLRDGWCEGDVARIAEEARAECSQVLRALFMAQG